MKQHERRQQTLGLLLQTVKELIAEKGCDAIKMSDMMERSGLSKGAIFHYVQTKDEIFALLLQERLESIDDGFTKEVNEGAGQFEGPLRQITARLHMLEDPKEITNQALTYLLGKSSQPIVAETLQNFYEQSLRLSKRWIETGQRHGVIPASIDADKAAELFFLVSCGLRMRSAMSAGAPAFTADDFAAFLAMSLHPAPPAH